MNRKALGNVPINRVTMIEIIVKAHQMSILNLMKMTSIEWTILITNRTLNMMVKYNQTRTITPIAKVKRDIQMRTRNKIAKKILHRTLKLKIVNITDITIITSIEKIEAPIREQRNKQSPPSIEVKKSLSR